MAHTAVVVDDHDPTRAVVCRLVELAGAVVIAETADVAGTLAVVEQLRPTVLVMDVQLPDGTGIEAARMISAGPSPPRIVLMSADDYGDGAGRCGAHAFIPKDQLSVAAFHGGVRMTVDRSHAFALAAISADVVIGVLAMREQIRLDRSAAFLVSELAGGALIGVAAVMIWRRRPENRCWWLLIAAAIRMVDRQLRAPSES